MLKLRMSSKSIVWSGLNSLVELDTWLNKKTYSQIIILVDKNTHQHCLPIFLNELSNLKQFEILEIPAGENNKVLNISEQLWLSLMEFNADKKTILINLGGGVVCDMGAFVASIYKRGIDFINIPTTLLAMIDASIGGKNGVNLNGIKNVIGTITLPQIVCVFPLFLKSLSQAEILNGLAEAYKHALIKDENYWNFLIRININNVSQNELNQLINTSILIKTQIVKQDLKEHGIRKILNYGHTIGHALEAHFLQKGNVVLHGIAVIEGIIIENILAVNKGILNKKTSNTIYKELRKQYKPILFKLDEVDAIIHFMMHDKKNVAESFNLSLITEIGNCIEKVECNKKDIRQALENYLIL